MFSAVYTGGTGHAVVIFQLHTVQNGDLDMDGISIGTGLLGNSATIKDAVNNNASHSY